jgi:flagellar FliL protein
MATGKNAPKKSADNEAAEAKPKSRLLLIVLILVILLGAGGAAAWYFLVFKAAPAAHGAKPAAAVVAEAAPPVFLPLEAFTVNLQPEDGERFLQTTLTLQVSNPEQVEVVKTYLPHVRSRLLLLLSSKKPSEILTVDGKNKLAQEIIEIFKKPFVPQGPTVNVLSVLFTSFVVQ